MTPPRPGDGGLDPTLGATDPTLAAKRLDVALELTKLWLGETSWYAPGSVYEQAAIIGRVFEAYRRQLDEGRPVDPTTVFDPQDNHPAAIGPLEWPAWAEDDEDDEYDEDDEDEDE